MVPTGKILDDCSGTILTKAGLVLIPPKQFKMKMIVKSGKDEKAVKVINKVGDLFTIAINDKEYQLDIIKVEEGVYSILYGGRSINMEMIEGDNPGSYKVNTLHAYFEVDVVPVSSPLGEGKSKKDTHQMIKAPMPGKIVKIKVAPGDKVEKGTPLVVLSAMKMENEIRSEGKGIVSKIKVKEDELVKDGQIMIDITAE
jgi:biotin carboxyl carrier protein